VTYEAVGRIDSCGGGYVCSEPLPTWSPAHIPGNDEVFVRWTWNTPSSLVYSTDTVAHYNGVPVYIEAVVGGITIFPQLRSAWSVYVAAGEQGVNRQSFLIEQGSVGPPGYPSDAGAGRDLSQIYLTTSFEPGTFESPVFRTDLPLDQLLSARIGFTFSTQNTSWSYESTLTEIRRVPEPSTAILLVTGLITAAIRRRRQG
jgi:hypothetical protein